MAPILQTHFHTMSNPNTNALMSMLQGALKSKPTTVVGFKIVEIGTEKLPVSIMDMVSIDGTIWEKKACFDCLASAMYNHIDNISTPDLLTVVA